MQTTSRYLVWKQDQSDFEIHVPVIRFNGIPLNNTCKANLALRDFNDSKTELVEDLKNISANHEKESVRKKATDYMNYLNRQQISNEAQEILKKLFEKEEFINIRAVELNAAFNKSIIKTIEGTSQNAIKSDIRFSETFLDDLVNKHKESIRSSETTNPLDQVKANALKNIKKFPGNPDSLKYDEKIALIYFALNKAYKEYTGLTAIFALEKLALSGFETPDIPIENSEEFEPFHGEKINPKIWKNEGEIKNAVIDAWKKMVPENNEQSFDCFFEETFEFISHMHDISPPVGIKSDLLEQILDKNKNGFDNLHLEHINFLIQLILVRTHWQAIENGHERIFSFRNHQNNIEGILYYHVISKEKKCIISSLISFYSEKTHIQFNQNDIEEISISLKQIWANLTGGHYISNEISDKLSSFDHFDELLFLSKRRGTCFQSGLRLSITLPKYAEIFENYSLKKYSEDHDPTQYKTTPIKNKPMGKIEIEDNPLEFEFDISEEEAEEIYGPDWKSIILALQLESQYHNESYIEPKKPSSENNSVIKPKTDLDTNMIYILGFISTCFLLAGLSLFIPPLMQFLQFGILIKIPLIDGLPILNSLIFVGTLSVTIFTIISSIKSFNSNLPQPHGPKPLNSSYLESYDPIKHIPHSYESNQRNVYAIR